MAKKRMAIFNDIVKRYCKTACRAALKSILMTILSNPGTSRIKQPYSTALYLAVNFLKSRNRFEHVKRSFLFLELEFVEIKIILIANRSK